MFWLLQIISRAFGRTFAISTFSSWGLFAVTDGLAVEKVFLME